MAAAAAAAELAGEREKAAAEVLMRACLSPCCVCVCVCVCARAHALLVSLLPPFSPGSGGGGGERGALLILRQSSSLAAPP